MFKYSVEYRKGTHLHQAMVHPVKLHGWMIENRIPSDVIGGVIIALSNGDETYETTWAGVTFDPVEAYWLRIILTEDEWWTEDSH